MTGSLSLSVVVPAHNARDLLREMLIGLGRQEGAFEIIVVDDASTDGTLEMLVGLTLPHPMRVLPVRVRSRAAARNRGAAAAHGDVLLFMDADVRPASGLVQAHLRHHQGADPNGRGLGVQGRTLQDPETMTTVFMRATNLLPDLTVRRREHLSPLHVVARNFSVTAEAFRRAGGFDEAFSGYGWEDIELGIRLAATGVPLRYEPDALAYHRHAETLASLRVKMRQAGEGAVYFWRKHGRNLRLGLFLEIHPLLLPLKWVVYRLGLITRLVHNVLPWAERRALLPIASECYNHLLWRSYYEGVFAALWARRPVPVAGRESSPV